MSQNYWMWLNTFIYLFFIFSQHFTEAEMIHIVEMMRFIQTKSLKLNGTRYVGAKWHFFGAKWNIDTRGKMVYFIKTHWGRMTHICASKRTTTGSDNDLSPGRRQAIIWTNSRLLLIGPLGTNFRETLITIQTFSFKKMHSKMSSAKWRTFCLGLNTCASNPLGMFWWPHCCIFRAPRVRNA